MSQVLEEHIGYLSDPVRTKDYRRAVAQAIRLGDRVVDVGCGVGPLGLMCLEAGAAHVYGIDHSSAIAFAQETMRRGGLEDRYTCIASSSYAATLPERVDVVICDHVGYFGFDYSLLGVMADAVRRFLKPGGRIIPARLEVYAGLVASSEAAAAAHAWSADAIPAALRWIDEASCNSKHRAVLGEPDIASPEALLGAFDLADGDPHTHIRLSTDLAANRDAVLDGLGGWFRCHLADGITMTNSPFDAGRISRPNAFLPFTAPLAVRAGDTIAITISARPREGVLGWTARNRRTGEARRQSTLAGVPLAAADLVPPTERRPRLGNEGQTAQVVLGYVDGERTEAQIAQAVMRDHPALVPPGLSAAEVVSKIIKRYAR
jgi:protein arginine N-methyltransferase 1